MPKQIIAIACSDIHLTLTPPLARSQEPDWLAAQARPLTELKNLAEKHDVPILCAGDVFDRWNCPVALTNWALDFLPKMIAIPGQHDLPYHRLEDIRDSAYWNLVKHGTVLNLFPEKSHHMDNLVVQGFPWGTSLSKCPKKIDKKIYVALVHQYIWIDGHSYPGAPEESKAGKEIWNKGWDVVVFGDNHKGFMVTNKKQTIFNCGALQRRKSDEIDYEPQVGLIYSDGSVEPFLLDCHSDIIEETTRKKEQSEENIDLDSFLEELGGLASTEIDFLEIVKHHMATKSKSVQNIIIEALEKV